MGLVATLLAMLSSAKSRASVPLDEPASNSGRAHLRLLCQRAAVGDAMAAFLEFVAAGESGWNNLVGLGVPERFPAWAKPNRKASASLQRAETRAAETAYRRNEGLFLSCGHSPTDYGFGSGGWFGLLPANALTAFRGTRWICLPPSSVFDPAASLCFALGYATRLQGWANYQRNPTWLALRVGWGAPGRMDNAAHLADRRKRYAGTLDRLGWPASWLDERPPALQYRARDLANLYETLKEGA